MAGIISALVMIVVTFIAPMIGIPEMSPQKLLSGMLGMPVAIGWGLHFMIGFIFASVYTYWADSILRIKNSYLKGTIFGISVFIFTQVTMAVMWAMIPMPAMEGSMLLMMIGGMIGHIVFGMAVAKTAGNIYSVCKTQLPTKF